MFQAFAASATGGYWFCLSNVESLGSNTLSLLCLRLFAIRKALILNEKKVDLDNGITISLHKDFAVLSMMNVSQYKPNDFQAMPSNFLDAFRILEYCPPDIKKIIEGYLRFFGLEPQNVQDLSEKIVLFTSLLNKNLLRCNFMINGGISRADFKDLMLENSTPHFNKPSFVSVFRVLDFCKNEILDKKHPFNEEMLWKAVSRVFRGILNSNQQNLIGNLFSNVFNFRHFQ